MVKTYIEDSLSQCRNNKKPRSNNTLKKYDFSPQNIKIDAVESASGNRPAVVYLAEVVSYSTIKVIESRIRDIKASSAKEIQSYLLDILNTKSSIFPLVRKTKQVELARRALLKGGVLIFIDGAKYALVAPRTLGQSLLEVPGYLDCICPMVSRALSYIALLISLFLSSLYIIAFAIPLRLLTPEIVLYMQDITRTIIYTRIQPYSRSKGHIVISCASSRNGAR